ncbi:class I SAM-dependent methyltransferase [Microlunatus elymi]|uniref:Class I SAM-dependent methyltransferase n=1 Tax=Microlunatus elymi TaxID=2596828 RepID=A0A516Q119_9ACTN|nr:class I SAM-dependent methyltransferase [Microlunatus elymi]QDP97129.1 class I SAM-dependent methyltransferase [Microlunatus elymi]
MVTLPSESEPTAARAPYQHRELAESFGTDAERYDRARPHYPPELAELVLADLGPADLDQNGPAGPSVLDVGIGTGISAARFVDAGCSLLGVEVDERMAEVARRRGLPVEIGRFEQWDARGRRLDLLISGQTWHWIDPDAGARKAAEVLRPGGRIALFWNVADPEPELAHAFADVYRSVDTGLPFTPWAASAVAGYQPITKRVIEGLRQTAAFTEPEQHNLDWSATVTRDDWLDVVPTSGGHNRIPPAILQQLLDGMAAVIDRAGGSFTLNSTTLVIVADRL